MKVFHKYFLYSSFVCVIILNTALTFGMGRLFTRVAARSQVAFQTLKRAAVHRVMSAKTAVKNNVRAFNVSRVHSVAPQAAILLAGVAGVRAVDYKTKTRPTTATQTPLPQRPVIKFTSESVKKYSEYKQNFIAYAKTVLATKDAPTTQAIVQLIAQYPDAAEQLAFKALEVEGLDPAIKKALSAHIPSFANRYAAVHAPKLTPEQIELSKRLVVAGTETDQQSKDEGSIFSFGNVVSHVGLPLLFHYNAASAHNNECEQRCIEIADNAPRNADDTFTNPAHGAILAYKQGAMLTPQDMVETAPHALVTSAVTSGITTIAKDIIQKSTGMKVDIRCPEMDPNRSYLQAHYGCRLARFAAYQIVHGAIASQVSAYFTQPLFRDSLVTWQTRADENGKRALRGGE